MSEEKSYEQAEGHSPGATPRPASIVDAITDPAAFREAEARITASDAAVDEYISLSIDHANLHAWHAVGPVCDRSADFSPRGHAGRDSIEAVSWTKRVLRPKAAGLFFTAAVLLVAILTQVLEWYPAPLGDAMVVNAAGQGAPLVKESADRVAELPASSPSQDWRPPTPIALAEQRPDGDLKVRLVRNFDRLESEDYQPRDGQLPNVGTSRGWPGDYPGRTALALMLLSQVMERDAIHLPEIWDGLPDRMNSRGYFGPIYPQGCFDEQQLSSNGWVLRALCEHHQWRRDAKSLAMIRRMVKSLVLPAASAAETYPRDLSVRDSLGRLAASGRSMEPGWRLSRDDGCVFIFMDGVIHALETDPTPDLRAAAESFVRLFCDTDLEVIQAQTHASLTGMRAALSYYRLTGDKRVLDNVQQKFDCYKLRAMTETYENYNWFGRPTFTEPCGVIDSYLVATELWRLVGDPAYLEDAHHIYFNGFAAAQRQHGGFGQNCCVGPNGEFLNVEVDEAHWCCTMRGAEGLVRAAQFAYFTTEESAFVTGYATNQGRLHVGDSAIEISQESRYPFEGSSRLEIKGVVNQREIELRFFSPSFARDLVVTVNGLVPPAVVERGFTKIKITPSAGDVVDVRFDMESGWSDPVGSGLAAERQTLKYGPLVLAMTGGRKPGGLTRDPRIRNIGGGAFVANNNVVLHALYNVIGPVVPEESDSMRVLFDRGNQGE